MLKKIIILFAVVGVCSFIAANLYSNMSKNQANAAIEHETGASGNKATESAKTSLDIEAVKKAAAEKSIKLSVPEGAIDIPAIVYGDENAPIVIEEFASFTCTHCANFYRDMLPKIKSALIDTGIAKLHFYSVVGDAQSLEATMVVHCQKDNASRKHFTGAILSGMEQWAYSTNYQNGLRTIAKVGGMSEDDYNKCVADKALQEKIIKSRQWFDKQVGVTATPYFRIGEQVIKGEQGIDAFNKAITDELESKPKPEQKAELEK